MSVTITLPTSTKAVTPHFTEFDNEGLTFLGSTVYSNQLFDMYVSANTRHGAEIICAHEDSHCMGPMAMLANQCTHYTIGHPMYNAYHLAKAKGLI